MIDVITLGTCVLMFVCIRARFRFVLTGGNLTAQSTGEPQGGGIRIPKKRSCKLSFLKSIYHNVNYVSNIGLPVPVDRNSRPFAARHSCGKNMPCWRAKVALRQNTQKAYIILNGNFLCLSRPRATFALQHGGFLPREWLAAKGLLSV